MWYRFWTPAGFAGRLGVSLVTLRRWKRTGRLPRWAQILIEVLDGELDRIDPAFRGWLLRNGKLISPEGWCFTPGEVRTIPLLYGQINYWRLRTWSLEGCPGLPPPYLGHTELTALAVCSRRPEAAAPNPAAQRRLRNRPSLRRGGSRCFFR